MPLIPMTLCSFQSDFEKGITEVEGCKERSTSSEKFLVLDNHAPAEKERSRILSMDKTAAPKVASNVGFVCLKSEEETEPAKLSGTVPEPSGEPLKLKNSPQLNLATKYRKALQAYQRKQKWYNPSIICSIDRMTDQIYEELISSVASEINIDHIISNLIELELEVQT
ncbi:hypothetical protein GE061_001855 [Apolygus lucorum]|uniref:Uncharacterized protein n=1 Tax=Apolygus lucorum TaxID=248454 RepID=A0A8S9X4V4_APOLU|nr:hypothetical protein GE061_001855 [Apolygus lucorum]